MLSIVAERTTFVRFGFWKNAYWPMDLSPFFAAVNVSIFDVRKARVPIRSSEGGDTTWPPMGSSRQAGLLSDPSVSSFGGSNGVTFVREEHPSKQPMPMTLVVSGRTTLPSFGQEKNTYSGKVSMVEPPKSAPARAEAVWNTRLPTVSSPRATMGPGSALHSRNASFPSDLTESGRKFSITTRAVS